MSKTKQAGLTVPGIIRAMREHAGLTQVALGQRLRPRKPQSGISDMERARRGHQPTPKTVFAVAKACGVTVILTADGWRILPG